MNFKICIDLYGHISGKTASESTSLDITWNRLPSVSSILLVPKDSEEEDDGDEEGKGDEHLQCLRFPRESCFLGEGEDFSVDKDKEVLL